MREGEVDPFLTRFLSGLSSAGNFSKNRGLDSTPPHFVHIGIPMGLVYWSGWFVRLAVAAGVAQETSDLAVERA